MDEQKILKFWEEKGYNIQCTRGGKSRKIKTKKQKGGIPGMEKSETLQKLLNTFNCFKPNQIYPEKPEFPV